MKKTIMTVDDSSSMRQMISLTLRQAGYDVIEARDGKDALLKTTGKKIDMFFVDLNMPNMNGIELIKNIRSQPSFKFSPIIMLTTESQAGKKQEGKAAGATGWIVKPFKAEQLTALTKRLLRV